MASGRWVRCRALQLARRAEIFLERPALTGNLRRLVPVQVVGDALAALEHLAALGVEFAAVFRRRPPSGRAQRAATTSW